MTKNKKLENDNDELTKNYPYRKVLGEVYEEISPDDPSDDYFSFAFTIIMNHRAKKRSSLDSKKEILLSCISSFLSLESSINRLYYDTFEREDYYKKKIKPSIPSSIVKHVKESWENMPIRNKFILLPPLISDFEFDTQKMPFTLFEEFRRFRNRLVHSKMNTTTYKVEITSVEDHSYGGIVLEKTNTSPNPNSIFPVTQFSTSFGELSIKDSEKAFEIAYRMRMELSTNCLACLPALVFESPKGGLKFECGSTIAKNLSPFFGDLKWDSRF